MESLQQLVVKLKALKYYNVNVLDWLLFAILTILLWKIFRYIANKFCQKLSSLAISTSTRIDDVLSTLFSRLHTTFLFSSSAFICANLLGLSGDLRAILSRFLIITVFYQIGLWGNELITLWLRSYVTNHFQEGSDEVSVVTYGAINYTCRFLMWMLIGLLLLDNLGVDITALITGLGIGGIAIALAVQNILGDVIASLSIVIDRPFKVGDFIIIEDKMGTVESIGLKTTRVRSLSGEQLVFANKQLIESQIRNFKRMNECRVVFGFGVTYDTPYEKLEKNPTNGASFSRIHTQNSIRSCAF